MKGVLGFLFVCNASISTDGDNLPGDHFPALSREMGRMRDEGLIEFHMASVRICQVEALKQMAE